MNVSQSSVNETDIPVCHVCQPLSQITVASLSSTQTNQGSKTDTLTEICYTSLYAKQHWTIDVQRPTFYSPL
jgi:hypothetical protein